MTQVNLIIYPHEQVFKKFASDTKKENNIYLKKNFKSSIHTGF